MFTIQVLDHEEGSGARWSELSNARHETKELTRAYLRKIRASYDEWNDDMYSYRIVEVDSTEYYSQPTDKGEY